MREIRMLRAMRRGLETGLRQLLHGHEGGNPGYSQRAAYGLPRQFPTLPRWYKSRGCVDSPVRIGSAFAGEDMNQKTKEIGVDLAIELAGAAIVAFIVWIATSAASQLAIPTWTILTIASAIVIAVVLLVAFLVRARHLRRVESNLGRVESALELVTLRLQGLRTINRGIADNLKSGDEPTVLQNTTSYTVDPNGNDRVESVWRVAYREAHQGRVFTTEDWGSPPTGEVDCTCHSEVGTIAPILVIDEPGRKEYVLHLHPPVGTVERQIEVRLAWPGLWVDLRKKGKDYVEVKARPSLQECTINVYIPESLGAFKWETQSTNEIKLTSTKTGAQLTLTMHVPRPRDGQTYRADLVRM